MPPNGLYSIPRHHLSSSTFLSRPTYSALDLAEEEAKKMAITDKVNKDRVPEATAKVEKKKSKKKHKKHGSCDGATTIAISQEDNGATEGDSTVTHNTSDPIVKHKKRNKKSKEAAHVSSSSQRKRKRDSEITVITPIPIPGEVSALVNQNEQEPEKRKSKKKSKPILTNGDADLVVLSKLPTPSERLQTKPREKLECKSKDAIGDYGSHKKKSKKNKRGTDRFSSDIQELSERASKTPIPLPTSYTSSVSGAIRTQPRKQAKESVLSSEVLVPETPPSLGTYRTGFQRKTPIPFPSLSSSKRPATTPKMSGMGLLTPTLTSSSPVVDVVPPRSVPPAIAVPQTKRRRSDVSSQPTPGAGSRITRPLLDQPKPRPIPRSSRASSVTSTSSRASSISIPEMFNRIGMPHVRSGANLDPFIAPQTKKTKPREFHDDTLMNDFDAKFGELLLAVNFSVEQEYLNQYHDWHTDNDSEYPFPCLGKGSGCTPKKEEMLHLSKRENTNGLKALEIDGGDQDALQDADERAKQAEEFLALAVRAHIPVPVGRLEGTWTLYCPQYSEHHFDRYGYGMRTLTISRIAGFKDTNSYFARLSIPPRSMVYSILTFHVPPHASFRTVTIKTATEGYTMDVIFLGNGYLHLRVDLQLLLKGKPAELVGGKKVYMEFMGVHEKAVKWAEKRDGFEEGRKLFSKYEGMCSE